MKSLVTSYRNYKRKGISLVGVLVLGSVLSVVALYVFDYLNNMRAASKNLELQLKAKMLAEDALEVTKYLLFYERIFSLNNPKHMPSSLTAMDDGPSGRGNWIKACASLDYMAGGGLPTPIFKVKRVDSEIEDETLCTTDLKDFRLSGENWGVYLEKLANLKNSPYEKIGNGKFKIKTISFNPQDSDDPDEFLKFNIEEKFKIFIKKIEVDIYFFTKDAGFDSLDNERYIRISSKVIYGGKSIVGIGESQARVEETIMFRASNMKNFALFMAYSQAGAAPYDFATQFNLDKDSHVFGKSYFRNDIDFTTLINFSDPNSSNMATYHDTLVLSGNVINIPAPTIANINVFKKFFKNGLLVNLGEEYIFDTPTVNNVTGGLKSTYNIENYVYNPNAIAYCIGASATDKPTITIDGSSNCSDANVGDPKGDYVPIKGKNIEKIIVDHSHAFIMAPSKELLFVKDHGYMYGVFLGGKISGKATNVFSLEMLRNGLPGLDSTNDALKNINLQANRTHDMIGVPLRNLPIVLRGK